MGTKRPDVIELLESERDWHKEQIERIDLALKVLRGQPIKEETKSTASEKIQWAREISSVFVEFGELTLKQVREKLAIKGISKALESRYNPTIFSTLKRKVKQGELEKVEYGRYRKTLPKRRIIIPKKKEEAPMSENASSF